ncbi:MAG: SIMPL domain-containing protein [Gemmatimonadales bacterium]
MRGLMLVVAALVAINVSAQDGPVIRTSGSGEVRLAPDWAVVSIGVSARGETAGAASREQMRLVTAVWDAVTRAGIPRDSVKTQSVSVQPILDYQARDRTVIGYQAQAALVFPVRDLGRLGTVLDAALSSGATALQRVTPRSTREDAVRAEVLTQAVAAARADAETLARAAGGQVGTLLELSTAPESGGPQPMLAMRAVQEDAGPAMPDLVIRASVSGTWRFRTR